MSYFALTLSAWIRGQAEHEITHIPSDVRRFDVLRQAAEVVSQCESDLVPLLLARAFEQRLHDNCTLGTCQRRVERSRKGTTYVDLLGSD